MQTAVRYQIEDDRIPERLLYVPCVLEGVDKTWKIRQQLTVEYLKKYGEDLTCNIVDLEGDMDSLNRDKYTRVKVSNYFRDRTSKKSLYCQVNFQSLLFRIK